MTSRADEGGGLRQRDSIAVRPIRRQPDSIYRDSLTVRKVFGTVRPHSAFGERNAQRRQVRPHSRRHLAAFLRTLAARGGALPAMVVIVLPALLHAPVASLRTDRAHPFGEAAVADHGAEAVLAQIDAFDAALGTVVVALVPRHLVQTVLAGDDALLTCLDAV